MVLAHRRELLLANLIAILGTLAIVPVPLLIPMLVDEVLLNKPGAALTAIHALFPAAWQGPPLYIGAILLLTLLLRFLGLVLGVWQMRQFTRISKDVIFRMRRSLLLYLQRVSMAEYETLGSGTVASHLVTDLDAVDTFIGSATSKFLVAVLSIVGTAAVLLWMHWQLALFILLLNPLVIYVTTVLGRKVKELKARENSAYQLFQESLSETLDAIQQIRAANRERHYIHRIIGSADHIRHRSIAFTWKSEAAEHLSFVIFLFGFDLFRAVSMFMVLYSDLSIGEMLAVFAYLWFMMGPVREVLGVQYAWHGANAALERINRLLDIRLEPQYPHKRDPFRGKETVSVHIEHVSFAYGDGPPVLDDVSLEIPAGRKVALVGASGGGKTTLVQTLLGLYPPDRGRILFDGVPVQEIGMDVVRDNVATVLQHPALFNDSVRMNLSLGRPLSDAAPVAGAGGRPAERHHRRAAAGSGLSDRPRRHPPLRGPAAASGGGAHGADRTQGGDPGRGHIRSGYRDRTASTPGAPEFPQGPHHRHHRPSPSAPLNRPTVHWCSKTAASWSKGVTRN